MPLQERYGKLIEVLYVGLIAGSNGGVIEEFLEQEKSEAQNYCVANLLLLGNQRSW